MNEIWVESRSMAKRFNIHHMGEKGKWTEASVRSERDLPKLVEAQKAGAKRAFISCGDWSLLPQKELSQISKKLKLIAKVKSADEARELSAFFDKLIAGFFVSPAKTKEIEKLISYLSGEGEIYLEIAAITGLKRTDPGERSVIDTCEIMGESEGLLVGSDSNSFFLVQAEVSAEGSKTHHRPFRINAGAVSLSTLLQKRKPGFLADIEAGDDVLIVDRKGEARKALVGRNEIERKPMVLVEASVKGTLVRALLQDSDDVRLLAPKDSKSVSKLKTGDKVLVHIRKSPKTEAVIEK